MADVINLAENYSQTIGEYYYLKTRVADALMSSKDIQFDGSRKVTVVTPNTVPLTDYKRSGQNRYGTPADIGDSAQEFEMEFDRSFTGVFDKGNQKDSKAYEKSAASFLKRELNEQVYPEVDKNAMYRIAHAAGQVVADNTTITKSNVLEILSAAQTAIFNKCYDDADTNLFIPASLYGLVRIAPDFLNLQELGIKAVSNGHVGDLFSMHVIKIPDSYMPANAKFLVSKKDAAFVVNKLQDAKAHIDPPGYSGSLMEGRVYYDAFVRAEKANGVYVFVNASAQVAAPTLSVTGKAVTISNSAASGVQWYYTTDGSDPRYSKTRLAYSAAVTCQSGDTFKAAGIPTRARGKVNVDLYPSAVVEKKIG